MTDNLSGDHVLTLNIRRSSYHRDAADTLGSETCTSDLNLYTVFSKSHLGGVPREDDYTCVTRATKVHYSRTRNSGEHIQASGPR